MGIIENAIGLSRDSGRMGGSIRDYFIGDAMNRVQDAQGIRRDYDYALAGGFQGLSTNGRGHYSDIGKMPNHPTFSNESAYSGMNGHQGGVWDNVNGVDRYTPSTQMMQDAQRMEQLKQYWDRAEKGNILNLGGKK